MQILDAPGTGWYEIRSTVMRFHPLLAGLVVWGAMSACGPIQSTAYLLDAEVQIEAARTAGAEKMAPYEWTAANLYIHKAREEVGDSDFETGVDYAGKAQKFARDAREKALAAAKNENATP